MEEARERLKALMGETGTTQADLVRYINGSPSVPYGTSQSEMSNALSGTLTSPKAGRIIEDSLSHIEKVARRAERGD